MCDRYDIFSFTKFTNILSTYKFEKFRKKRTDDGKEIKEQEASNMHEEFLWNEQQTTVQQTKC